MTQSFPRWMAFAASACVLFSTSPMVCAGLFVYETATEYTAMPDLDANGFADILIIDKATGLYRVGHGTATASVFTFAEGRPSGTAGVTGVAVGRLNGLAADAFAVTAPSLNRIHILSPTTSGYTEPTPVLDLGAGPRILAALDIPGGASPTAEDDLAVIHESDLSNATMMRQIRSNAGTWTLLRSDDLPDVSVSQGNPIVPHTGAAALFAFVRDDGATNSFRAWNVSGTSATEVLSVAGLADGSRFICDVFAGANADVLTWVPGQVSVQVHRIVAGAPWSITSSTNYTLSHPVAQLVPVHDPAGTGVLIRYDNGSVELRGYSLATGFTAPLSIVPTGATGSLSGVVPMPGNAFQLLYSDTPGGPTSRLITFENNGSGWTQTGTSNLPPLRTHRQYANLLLLEAPLFRGDVTSVLRSYQAGDWITGAVATGGGPFTVIANAATFGGSTQGIGSASAQAMGSVTVSPGGAAMSQMHPQFSLFSFGTNLGPAIDSISISPSAGTYATARQITFSGMSAGTTVHYRMNGSGAFQTWDPSSPPWITHTTTVEFYAGRSSGNSPVQSARYDFSVPPAMQDSDGDGAPDFVELAYGMDPAGGDDADRDGFGDLDELAAGTNPNDAGSHPASEAAALDTMLVDARARVQDVDATILGIASAGTTITVTNPFGDALGSGTIGTGAANAQFGRVNARGVNARHGFLVVRSAQHFGVNPSGSNEPRGRELAAILPALEPESWSWSTADGSPGVGTAWGFGGVNFQPGSSNWNGSTGGAQGADANWSQRQLDPLWDSSASGQWSAAGWITELQAAMNRGAQPYAEVTLTPATTLVAVLFGHLLHQTIAPRLHFDQTVNGGALDFAAVLPEQLWQMRRPDVEISWYPVSRTIAMLRQVDTGVHGTDPEAQVLRRLARDLYAQHQALALDHLGDMMTPMQAMAYMAQWYSLPFEYYIGSSLTNEEINVAINKMASLISNPPVRTATIQFLEVRSVPSPPGLPLLQTSGGSPRLLLNAELRPLSLPGPAEAPAGSVFRVKGYQDMPLVAGLTAIEVLEISLQALPFDVGEDSDGDLLADVWELRHFGTLAYDGTGNQDGSLYPLMQEYFEGTDPNSNSSNPPVDPAVLEFFDLEIMNDDPPWLLVHWPYRYANAIQAYFEQSDNLADWSSLPHLPAFGEGGFFYRSIDFNAQRRFFRPKAGLRH